MIGQNVLSGNDNYEGHRRIAYPREEITALESQNRAVLGKDEENIVSEIKIAPSGNFSAGNGIDHSSDWRDLLENKPIIKRLARCESGLKSNIEIKDTNGEMSRGILMFQDDTFLGYLFQYGFYPDAEKEELKNFISDPRTQILLAERMINDGLEHNWRNCFKKIIK